MRLATTFLTLAHVASLSAILAIHPHVLSHRDHKRNVTAATQTLGRLQYHVPRALIDTCVSVDADAALGAAGDAPLLVSALTGLCICLKDLDIQANANLQLLARLLGKDTILKILTDILKSPNSRRCAALPPHSRRACSHDDPCRWTCQDNFTREGDICACALPYKMCNGVCGDFPEACGASSIPRLIKRQPITTLAQAKATCRVGEEVCGIPGREGTLDFECININNALDSCGGCMSTHPFTDKPQSFGKDCSRLSNALEVECFKRTCVIHRCKDGFAPSESQDTCVRSERRRMKKYRRRGDSTNTNAAVYADSSLLAVLVNLSIKLRQDHYLLSRSNVAVRRFTWSTVYPVLRSLARVLTSPEVASLVTNTNTLLDVVLASSKKLNKCDCVDSLGLHDLVTDLDALSVSTVDLSQWLATNSVDATKLFSTTNNSSVNRPIIINLLGLLDKFGLGAIQSDVTIDGLDIGLSALVSSLLDGPGIGPNGVADQANNLSVDLTVNLDALLDLVLRLVLDTDTVLKTATPPKNLTAMVLQESVGNVVQATAALVDAIVHGHPTSLELSTLVNSSERALNLLRPSQLGSPIIFDLDQITTLSFAMNGPSPPQNHDKELLELKFLLDGLGLKGHKIDAAATGLGLDTSLALSLNSLLAGPDF